MPVLRPTLCVLLISFLAFSFSALGYLSPYKHLSSDTAAANINHPASDPLRRTNIANNNQGQNCVACHKQQVSNWQKSDHAKAMDLPSNTSILAPFNNETITHYTQEAKFYVQNNEYLIELTEQKNKTTYKVEYTFGHYPLQQYLVKTKENKLQVFPFSWDSRSKQEGGQTWYPNYQTEDVQAADRLHWQQPLQNWNGMCADCHSEGLKRNYSIASNTFDTQYDNINVGCQSCHGKMTDHSQSANSVKGNSAAKRSNNLGLDQQEKQQALGWILNQGDSVANWQGEKRDNSFMDTCFGCHSLRTPMTDGIEPGKAFLDQFSPSFLAQPLYYADGQIKEEVYVYGSFLQSKMYAAGVNCLDCHDAHTMKVKTDTNGLCLQCHNAENYQNEQHIRHDLTSDAGQCVNCHMPETTYMGVDDRRDHSFRIPRPHLSDTYETPNACINCHEDKTNQWAAKQLSQWHGKPKSLTTGEQLFIELLHNFYLPVRQHIALINDPSVNEIKRASALVLLPNSVQQLTDQDVKSWIKSDLPLIRLAMAQAGHILPVQERLKTYKELLNDEYKSIRVAAANQLVGLPIKHDNTIKKAFEELTTSNLVSSWRGEGNLNRSMTFARQGKIKDSIKALEQAIIVDPYFDAAYINLSDTYRQLGQTENEKTTLTKGLATNPKSAALHYAKGMFLIRSGDKRASVGAFAKAIKFDAGNSQYAYLYFLAMDSIGQTKKALMELKRVINRYDYNPQLIQLGLSFSQKMQDRSSYNFFQSKAN